MLQFQKKKKKKKKKNKNNTKNKKKKKKRKKKKTRKTEGEEAVDSTEFEHFFLCNQIVSQDFESLSSPLTRAFRDRFFDSYAILRALISITKTNEQKKNGKARRGPALVEACSRLCRC